MLFVIAFIILGCPVLCGAAAALPAIASGTSDAAVGTDSVVVGGGAAGFDDDSWEYDSYTADYAQANTDRALMENAVYGSGQPSGIVVENAIYGTARGSSYVLNNPIYGEGTWSSLDSRVTSPEWHSVDGQPESSHA